MMNVLATPIHSTAPILVNEALADDVLRGAEAIADRGYDTPTQLMLGACRGGPCRLLFLLRRARKFDAAGPRLSRVDSSPVNVHGVQMLSPADAVGGGWA